MKRPGVLSSWRFTLLALLCAGCGGGRAYSLSAVDNDPAALKLALAARQPERPAPGATVYAALSGGGLVSWDLEAGKARWSVPARVTSRVVATEKMVAAREQQELVARSISDGVRVWGAALPLDLLGLAADAERVYALVSDHKSRWILLAYDASGHELWRSESPGALGTPAAAGGLVYLPYLSQWLVLLDARTGKELARLRQEDEAVSWVRATPDGVTFGARGALLLDEGAAAGRREPGRNVAANLPAFANILMAPDAFDPAGASYSALDRTRLLWRVLPGMKFADDTVVLVHARYLFGFDATAGVARWAWILPSDAISAEDTGGAVVIVAQDGNLMAFDRPSGRLLSARSLGARPIGATLVAEGWRPSAGDEKPPAPIVEALAAVALDRDARFGAAKLFAVEALAAQTGPAAARALVDIAAGGSAAPDVARAAGEALVARRDVADAPVLVEALATHADYAAGQSPRAVEVMARALAALPEPPPEGAEALAAHLDDPATPPATVQEIAQALVAMKAAAVLPRLLSVLLLHRCDARFAAPAAAVAEAIAALGGPAEREALVFVADDPRTDGALRQRVRELLAGRPRR